MVLCSRARKIHKSKFVRKSDEMQINKQQQQQNKYKKQKFGLRRAVVVLTHTANNAAEKLLSRPPRAKETSQDNCM